MLEGLHGIVHIDVLGEGFGIHGRLGPGEPEAADVPEPELAVLDQTVFKGAAVESLEGDLPRLEQDNFFHIVLLPHYDWI